mgnify:CR=1 FL=1
MPVGALDTFPKLLMHHAAQRGSRPAIREKDLGIWQTWTWSQVRDEVRNMALGLQKQVADPRVGQGHGLKVEASG